MARLPFAGTSGSDDPTRAALPFLGAKGALESGHEAEIFLNGRGRVPNENRSGRCVQSGRLAKRRTSPAGSRRQRRSRVCLRRVLRCPCGS